MKNCDEIRILISVYLDGELESDESEILQKHIDECADCGEYLDELQNTVSKVRFIPEVKLPDRFHEETIKKLRDRLNPVDFLTPKEIKDTKKKKKQGKPGQTDTKAWLRAGVAVAVVVGCMFIIGQVGDLYVNWNEKDNTNNVELDMATPGINEQTNGLTSFDGITGEFDIDLARGEDTNAANSTIYSRPIDAAPVSGEAFIRRFGIIINVEDYDRTLELIDTLPGVTIGRSADYGARRSASISRNIDQANFMYAKEFLRSLGKIVNESENEYRVSGELIDLESRLDAKEEEIARLLSILEKSGSLSHLTAVERRISEAENERDNIKSQIQRYNTQITNCELSIIVNYTESPEKPSISGYTERLKGYFIKSVEFLGMLFENAVVFVAMISAPLVLVLVMLAVVMAIIRRRSNKHEKNEK